MQNVSKYITIIFLPSIYYSLIFAQYLFLAAPDNRPFNFSNCYSYTCSSWNAFFKANMFLSWIQSTQIKQLGLCWCIKMVLWITIPTTSCSRSFLQSYLQSLFYLLKLTILPQLVSNKTRMVTTSVNIIAIVLYC